MKSEYTQLYLIGASFNLWSFGVGLPSTIINMMPRITGITTVLYRLLSG